MNFHQLLLESHSDHTEGTYKHTVIGDRFQIHRKFFSFFFWLTLIRAAQKGLRTLLGNVACVWILKLRARNKDACCLMDGFLLSITPKMSSDKCWRVVFKGKKHGKTKLNLLIMTENAFQESALNPE